jgi:hypothetical protein
LLPVLIPQKEFPWIYASPSSVLPCIPLCSSSHCVHLNVGSRNLPSGRCFEFVGIDHRACRKGQSEGPAVRKTVCSLVMVGCHKTQRLRNLWEIQKHSL